MSEQNENHIDRRSVLLGAGTAAALAAQEQGLKVGLLRPITLFPFCTVRIAELDKEQKIGEQAAAFEKEAQVKDAERKMRIAIADANAKAIAIVAASVVQREIMHRAVEPGSRLAHFFEMTVQSHESVLHDVFRGGPGRTRSDQQRCHRAELLLRLRNEVLRVA